MVKIKGYWVDHNLNRWDCKYISEHDALLKSKSLIKCMNCTDCVDCCYCENCIECIHCKAAIFCRGCKHCIDCKYSKFCVYSKGAYHCEKDYKCIDCFHTSNCKKCKSCRYAESSSRCVSCVYCPACINCKECENSRNCLDSYKCKMCFACSDIESCYSCNWCIRCINCSYCSKCTGYKKNPKIIKLNINRIDTTFYKGYIENSDNIFFTVVTPYFNGTLEEYSDWALHCGFLDELIDVYKSHKEFFRAEQFEAVEIKERNDNLIHFDFAGEEYTCNLKNMQIRGMKENMKLSAEKEQRIWQSLKKVIKQYTIKVSNHVYDCTEEEALHILKKSTNLDSFEASCWVKHMTVGYPFSIDSVIAMKNFD